MKLLIITHSYTPDLTPRAFRWSAVAAQLVQMGHEVHVLCAAASSLVADDGVSVYRVRDWLLSTSTRAIPGAVGAQPPSSNGLRAVFRKIIRTVWRAIYWPDYACGWVLPAAGTARSLCAANHYEWIVSVSHPFTGHLVGLLAKACAPGSGWIVDIGDPFCLMREPAPNNRNLYAWLNRTVERRIVSQANAISVTTDSTRRLYESSFSLQLGKIRVIPPLLSLPPMPHRTRLGGDNTIRLVFIGTLYRKLRSPSFLLDCFMALVSDLPARKLELHFYGAVNDCANDLAACPEALRPRLHLHGMVERAEALQAMVDADVLVNIGNNSESQLASKVIEYMAVGKPILNLISIPQDASIFALAGYPAALTIMQSGDELPQSVIKALKEFVLDPPVAPADIVEELRQRYSVSHVARLYTSILEACQP